MLDKLLRAIVSNCADARDLEFITEVYYFIVINHNITNVIILTNCFIKY